MKNVHFTHSHTCAGWMSYDATASVAMEKGSYVKLSTAAMPVPTLNSRALDGDWFQSIRDKLHWNVRTLQKPMQAAQAASQAPYASKSSKSNSGSNSNSSSSSSSSGGAAATGASSTVLCSSVS
jgi:hypothetical protein